MVRLYDIHNNQPGRDAILSRHRTRSTFIYGRHWWVHSCFVLLTILTFISPSLRLNLHCFNGAHHTAGVFWYYFYFLFCANIVFFNLLFFLGTPFLGWLLDTKGLAAYQLVLLLMGCVMNGCAMVMDLPLQLLTFCLYSLYRVMIFTSVAAFISTTYYANPIFLNLAKLC